MMPRTKDNSRESISNLFPFQIIWKDDFQRVMSNKPPLLLVKY